MWVDGHDGGIFRGLEWLFEIRPAFPCHWQPFTNFKATESGSISLGASGLIELVKAKPTAVPSYGVGPFVSCGVVV